MTDSGTDPMQIFAPVTFSLGLFTNYTKNSDFIEAHFTSFTQPQDRFKTQNKSS